MAPEAGDARALVEGGARAEERSGEGRTRGCRARESAKTGLDGTGEDAWEERPDAGSAASVPGAEAVVVSEMKGRCEKMERAVGGASAEGRRRVKMEPKPPSTREAAETNTGEEDAEATEGREGRDKAMVASKVDDMG